MVHLNGSDKPTPLLNPLLDPLNIQFWTAVLCFMAIFVMIFSCGVLGGLQASQQAQFSLHVAGDHLRSAWECIVFALRVW